MRKMLLPLLLLTAMFVQSQTSEMFNRMSARKYTNGEWNTESITENVDYIITLNMEKRTLLITRSSDKLNMEFIQIATFVNEHNGATITGLLVNENRDTFPICGEVRIDYIEINFGELIYRFYREVYSDKL